VEDGDLDVAGRAVGARMGFASLVLQAGRAIEPEAGKPLIARLAGDTEEGTQTGEVECGRAKGVEEVLAFVHG